MPDTRRTLPISPLSTVNLRASSPDVRPTPRPSSDGIPRAIESPHRAPAPPPASSLTASLAKTQFAQGSDAHALEAAQTMQFAAAVTKPMAASSLDGDDVGGAAARTSTNLIAKSAAILACVPQHTVYDSYEASHDDASTRLVAKTSPAAVATGVMRPNARVVFPALPAVQLAAGTTPPANGRPGTLPPEARTAFVPAQQPIIPHPSSDQDPASNSSARTVFEPQPILAAARPAFPLPAPRVDAPTRIARPGTPSIRDAKSRVPSASTDDVQRAVQAILDKRRAFVAETFRDARVVSASDAPEEPTMLVSPLTTVGVAAREQVSTYEREAKTALLYMLLAVFTCVLAPVAWIHAEEQLIRSNALVFRIERAVGLALTLAAVAAIACGITVLVVR